MKQSGRGEWAYLNGEFVRAERARISPFDRGFLFAHAAYEVTAVFAGRRIDGEGHAARMARTLTGLEIPAPSPDPAVVEQELIARNGLEEGLIYLQVTGGTYDQRDFTGPETFTPSIFAFVTHKSLITDIARDGVRAVSLPDQRWARRDLKTTQLLSQALAYRSAKAQGADTAWMHENGVVTEAASANAWIVTASGELVTRDLSNAILSGITRHAVIDQARASGLTVTERAFTLGEVYSAREAFTSSAGALINPVIAMDGQPIGTGQPGPVTRSVQARYYAAIGADVAKRAPWALA